MENYQNLNGNSGVSAYEIGTNYISVLFNGSLKIYTYSYGKAGSDHVENMKQLARSGRGLNAYINQYVKFSYD
mgnify:CR=1 FL=1